MRFIEFRMQEFGPFADHTLSLAGGMEGLHLIYGPNEAGKSSSLRGIEQFLFGIPHRKAEATIRSGQQPRLTATLRLSSGEELSVTRRKAQKETLRDGNDERVIPESELSRFCGNIDRKIFQTMFGLGHQTLIDGGLDLLRGQGEVGQLLFAAGAGLAHLRRVRAELREQAEELFLPRGKKPRINQSLDAISIARKSIADEGNKSQEWVELDASLQKEKERSESLIREWGELSQRAREIEHRRDAIPIAVRRRQIHAQLVELDNVVRLPDDFRDRYRSVATEREFLHRQLAALDKELHELAERRKTIVVEDDVLRRELEIEQCHLEHGSHQKAARDRRSLVDQKSRLTDEATGLLQQLRPGEELDTTDLTELTKADQAKLDKLFREHERLINLLEQKTAEVDGLHHRVKRIEREENGIGKIEDVRELARTIERIRRLGDLDRKRIDLADQWTRDETALRREIESWTPWSGSAEELIRLPLPTIEAIEDLEETGARLKERRANVDAKHQEMESRLKAINEERNRQSRATEAPSEEELLRLRAERDVGWKIVERVWRDHEKLSGVSGDVGEEYEKKVVDADLHADRLRREAEAVAHHASLVAQRENLQASLSDVAAKQKVMDEELAAVIARWKQLWQPASIEPAGRREMKAWAKRALTAREAAHRLIDLNTAKIAIEEQYREYAESLTKALNGLKSPSAESDSTSRTLAELVDEGVEVLRQNDERRALLGRLLKEREEAEANRHSAEAQLERIQKDFDAWQASWKDAAKLLSLPETSSPAEAAEVLRGYRELWVKLRERSELAKRIAEIDRDADEFARQVSSVAEQVAKDQLARPVTELVSVLYDRLKLAREASTKLGNVEEQIKTRDETRSGLQSRQEELEATLVILCTEAGAIDASELMQAIDRSDRRRALEKEEWSLDEQLTRLSDGKALVDFIDELAVADPASLEQELSRISVELERRGEERTTTDRRIGDLQRQLQQIDGNDRAAKLAEDLQSRLAELKQDAGKYVRLSMACGVLEKSIERYRRENEGPVLRRASELFRELTLGSFESLEADFDASGSAILLGLRAHRSEAVPIPAMSEGTADQLYLALRLASLEMYLAQHESLPFIVDDILVNFDDERSIAALRVLANLSNKTQVLFFTHHRHLVELAQAHLDADLLFVHELPGRIPSTVPVTRSVLAD